MKLYSGIKRQLRSILDTVTHTTIWETSTKTRETTNRQLNVTKRQLNIYLLIHWLLPIWECAILRSIIIGKLSLHFKELRKYYQLITIIFLSRTKVFWGILLINSIGRDKIGGKMELSLRNLKVICRTINLPSSSSTITKASSLLIMRKSWRVRCCRLWDWLTRINFSSKILMQFIISSRKVSRIMRNISIFFLNCLSNISIRMHSKNKDLLLMLKKNFITSRKDCWSRCTMKAVSKVMLSSKSVTLRDFLLFILIKLVQNQ